MKISESGRSMVEMLGVLAVIGVLSMTGFAGYRYAINKHRANTILNEINMRWVVAQQQMTLNIPVSMSEFNDVILDNIEIALYEPENTQNIATLELSNVPTDVLYHLLRPGSGFWNLPITYLNVELGKDVDTFSFSHLSLISPAYALGGAIPAGVDITVDLDHGMGKECISTAVNSSITAWEKYQKELEGK